MKPTLTGHGLARLNLASAWMLLFLCGLAHGATGQMDSARPPMEITFGDWEVLDAAQALPRLKLFKEMGATSTQSYIFWNNIEKSPGNYDWSVYDQYVAALRASGLKWVPFVVAGPWNLTPIFARPADKVVFARCLEHNLDSKIPSIWCPEFRQNIETYLQAFADHYLPTGMLESVNLGITGDYGEAIYQVIGNWPGSYHSHQGMWCGDPLAEADLQKHCREAYGNQIGRLNEDWQTHYRDFAGIRPFNRQHAPSLRAWVFMLRWYRDSMTEYADWWMATARRIFKDTPLYLCTGGDMTAEHGSDFSAQAKVAARHGAGIRVTNEGSSLAANVYLTRLVSSATRFYGGFAGNEPASSVTPVGSLGRLFNAHTSGARQFYLYAGNILDGKTPNEAWTLLRAHGEYMRQAEPAAEVAVFYGTTNWAIERLEPDLFYRLRDGLDYDFVDERMALDGALDRYKVLLVYNVQWIPEPVVRRIREWVERGGALVTLVSRAKGLDEKTAPWDELIGLQPDAEETVGFASGMRVLAPDVLPSFKEAGHWITPSGMNRQTADCRILMRMGDSLGGGGDPGLFGEGPPLSGANAWLRPMGKGVVLAYWGSAGLATKEGDWNELPPLPFYFITDAIQHLVREGKLSGAPGTLWRSGQDPVYFSRMADGRIVAFNPDPKRPAKLSLDGKEFELAPQSIRTIDAPLPPGSK
jgi:hypothetical protein